MVGRSAWGFAAGAKVGAASAVVLWRGLNAGIYFKAGWRAGASGERRPACVARWTGLRGCRLFAFLYLAILFAHKADCTRTKWRSIHAIRKIHPRPKRRR